MTKTINNEELIGEINDEIEIEVQEDLDDCRSLEEIIYDDFEDKLSNEDALEDEEDEVVLNNIDLSGLPITLEDAVADFQSGEKEAFEYIYNHYKPKLERLSYRQNDEDLVQELSIVLMRAVETFNNGCGAKFNTYFWKCARNHMGTLNIRKSAKKRTAEFGTVSMQQSFNTKDSDVELGAFIEDKNGELNYEKRNFHMVLEENIYPYLKESEVKAIKMLLDGYTLEEIGEALGGITAPAIHVKFRRLAEKKIVGKQLRFLHDTYGA